MSDLKTYIGTKMIKARPSVRKDSAGPLGGYDVYYPNGYGSWSPSEAFENAYRPSGSLDFGAALFLLKRGYRMRRQGWNGKGMSVFLVDGSTFQVSRAPLDKVFAPGANVTYRPHLDMIAVDGTVGVWVPSQTDILAEDWEIVE